MIITLLSVFFYAGQSYCLEKKLLQGLSLQELNEKAPDFTISGEGGAKKSIRDYRGKVVILHFWATWCKPCMVEFPAFEKVYQAYKDKDLVFLPISIDVTANQADINAFAKNHKVTFPVFLARAGDVTSRYWTWGVPETYIVDKKGTIVGRALGPRDWASAEVKDVIDTLLKEK